VSNPEVCARLIGLSLIVMSIALLFVAFLWYTKYLSELELVFYLTNYIDSQHNTPIKLIKSDPI
jgi:hypothetical protein